jgi:hypothetical protein
MGYFFGVLLVFAIVQLAILFLIFRAGDPQKLEEQSIRQQTANIPAGNYLFLRCSGDEAAAALSAGQFIAWLGMKASKILDLLSRPFFADPKGSALQGLRIGFVLFPVILAIGYAWYVVLPDTVKLGVFDYFFSPHGPFFGRHNVVTTAFILFSVVAGSLALLCIFVALLIFVTQALTSWAFGWTRLSTGFLVELAIEPLPFGEHSLVHIDWGSGSTGLDGIVHSWTYSHPGALMHLQNWVRASLGKIAHDGC